MPESLANDLRAIDGVANVDSVRYITASVHVAAVSTAANSDVNVCSSAISPTRATCRWTSRPAIPRVRQQLAEGRSRARHRPGAPHRVEASATRSRWKPATARNSFASPPPPRPIMVGGMVVYMEGETARRLLNVEGVDMYIVNTDAADQAAEASSRQAQAALRQKRADAAIVRRFAAARRRDDQRRDRQPVGTARAWGLIVGGVRHRQHADDERARTNPRTGPVARRGHDPLAGPQDDPRPGDHHRLHRADDRASSAAWSAPT